MSRTSVVAATRGATEPRRSGRWEHGSDFHLFTGGGGLEAPWLSRPHGMWGSGRDALRAILSWGRDRLGWRRLLAPTYYCQDVVRALATELPVVVYDDAPFEPLRLRDDAGASDVLLLVNGFGMRRKPDVQTRAIVIEDHTHDPVSPWAFDSEAHYAIASLRKTMPLPDGGVLWSPRGAPVPPERTATEAHRQSVRLRLQAMRLKRQYLAGHAVQKNGFRILFRDAESRLGSGPVSGPSAYTRRVLATLPAERWRGVRGRNLATFREALGAPRGVRVLDAAFGATLLFDSHRSRERVRAGLVRRRIYPAVLWPLEAPVVSGIPERHVDLSRRVLTLHCDCRYGADDMVRVAAAVCRLTGQPGPASMSTWPVSDTAGRSR